MATWVLAAHVGIGPGGLQVGQKRRTQASTSRCSKATSASEQQAQVAREVDRNLVNIRDLASHSSSGADQTSAASHEMSRLAVNLNTLVGRFVIS